MPDEFDDLRITLREAADDFRPSLDPAALAEAGRRVQVRNRILGGVAGFAALAVAAGFGVPALLNTGGSVPAAPAAPQPPSVPASQPAAVPPGPATEASGFEVDMTGWKTFSSRQYPVTFQYPADWTVDNDLGGDGKDLGKTDGCTTDNCVLFVNPPDPSKAAPLELIRNGFTSKDTIGGGLSEDTKYDVVTTIPDLTVQSAGTDSAVMSQAVILKVPGSPDGIPDYMLGVADPRPSVKLAVLDASSAAKRPESWFLFSTNVGNIGGDYEGDGWTTVAMILGSTRPNPGFDPTRPTDDGTGTPVVQQFDKMTAPDLANLPDSSGWKPLEVKDGNIGVSVPPKWQVVDNGDGVIWIKAPSGYIIDLLTNGMQESCDAGNLAGSEKLGAPGNSLEATAPGESGPVDIQWQNGGEFPVWVGLVLRAQNHACFQRYLDFGGKYPVYLGSADNSANPTAKELSQAVAILASAKRLS